MDHKKPLIPAGEFAAMLIFLGGLVMSEVTAMFGVAILFKAIRHGTISQELGMLGIAGCLCYLLVTISWLYLRILNQE